MVGRGLQRTVLLWTHLETRMVLYVLETVEARLKQKWILPELSFMNNLAASVLWHRLSPVDPPVDLYLPNFSQ